MNARRAAAALAAAMGIGRFVYTPILPVMTAQAGLSATSAASLVGGTAAALVAVILFGATFLTIVATSLEIGADLGFPRAAAVLTAGYSAGQILGPLLATPLLHHGYHQALLLAAVIVLAAAITARALPSRRRVAARKPPHRTPAALAE